MSDFHGYEVETLDPDEDDGTMVNSKDLLAEAVVGRRIVSVEMNVIPEEGVFHYAWGGCHRITLDNGRRVYMQEESDCCAFTELQAFLLHPDAVNHMITGVGTTDGYTTWHIYADMGDILQLTVGWSAGNPFYYGYGFNIRVVDPS